MSHHTYSRTTIPSYRLSRSRVALRRLAKRFDAIAEHMPLDSFTVVSTTTTTTNNSKKEA